MSRYRVGINAGPVHVSRRAGGGKKPLTSVLVWFIVKPLELIFKGLGAVVRSRKNIKQPVSSAPQYWNFTALGWHNTVHGPLYFDGANWYTQDGRPLF